MDCQEISRLPTDSMEVLMYFVDFLLKIWMYLCNCRLSRQSHIGLDYCLSFVNFSRVIAVNICRCGLYAPSMESYGNL